MITAVGRAFIAASPFLVLATSNGDSIDYSPKGDVPGFVQLLDEKGEVTASLIPANRKFPRNKIDKNAKNKLKLASV